MNYKNKAMLLVRAIGPTGTDADQVQPVPFSEDQLAQDFGDRYACDMRYVARWNKWMVFHGNVWKEDDEQVAFKRARSVCRCVATKSNDSLIERKVLFCTAPEGTAKAFLSARLAGVSEVITAQRQSRPLPKLTATVILLT